MRHNAARLLVAGLLSVSVWGCVNILTGARPPNSYGPADDEKGYSQTRVGPDRFLVFFMGTWSEEERVRDLAMLRSAELALEHGFSHFNVLYEAVYQEGTDQSSGMPIPVGGGASIGLGSQSARLTARLLIQVVREPPEGVETVHRAQTVVDDVTARYEISR